MDKTSGDVDAIHTLKDHLGSASGNIVGEQRYYPFGETRFTTGTMYTDKLFTGQQEITGLGIYNYRARFFSPKLGRFLSADTIVPNLYNPQDFNRFSYVRNNPVKYTDPTGHWLTPGDGGEGGSIPPAQPPVPPSPQPGNTGGKPNDKNSPDPVPSNSPPDTGPIFVPLPDPIIDIGPIIIISPITLPGLTDPKEKVCKAINKLISSALQKIAQLAKERKKLIEDINNAQDPLIIKVLLDELAKLDAELLGKIKELDSLYKQAQTAGCSGWER